MDALPLLLASARVIGWALVHFVWQGALLGGVYAIARMALPRGEARYCFGMGVLVLLALCPLLTVWRLLETSPSVIRADTEVATPAAIGANATRVAAWAWDSGLDAVLPWLVLAWLFGVLLLSLRAWQQWRALKTLVRMAELMPQWQARVTLIAQRFGLRRHVTVLCSRVIVTPALVGWIRPVILLPMAVACNFPLAQLELILAHELAHLRRWDPLANLFQVILETLHFYHPVVHWISRDVRNEREICCDKLALLISGGSRHEFVAALAELGEWRERHGSLLLAASGGVLLDRVQQLVVPEHEVARARAPARFVAVLLGAALVALTLRLEWNQAQRQRSLIDSIVQVRSMLAPPWLPLPPSRSAWQLPDLALKHAAAMQPLARISTAANAVNPAPTPTDVSAARVLPRLAPLVSNLTLVRDELPAGVANPAVPPAASVAATLPPAPIRIRQPVYPQTALTQGIEGHVVVEFGLASDGHVRDLRVISAEPAGVFDQSTIQAMRGWQYSVPAGVALQRRYRQTMAFMLNATDASHAPSGTYAGAAIQARIGCQIVTGTHICRWPDDLGPHAGSAVILAGSH
jgi:bla regulator protein BlaR1